MVPEKQVVAFRAGGFHPRLLFSLAFISFVGVVIALEILCRTGIIGSLS